MDWWHVALDVRPSSASSSSTAAAKSSSSKSSSTDLFSKNLATAKQSATSAHKSSTPAPKAAAASKPGTDNSSKPKSAADSDDSKSKSSVAAGKSNTAADKSSAAGSAKGSAAKAAADAQSAQDGSATDDAAVANSADNSPTNGATKGRAPTRATPKTRAAQSTAAKGPGDPIVDPSADMSNQSGVSLLRLLAQSPQSDDSAAPATDTAGSVATDKSAGDGTDTTTNDPNAAALAMFTQALAAALGASAATQQGIVTNTPAGASGASTASVTDVTQSSNGASMQDLVSLIAQTVAADAKDKSDANAPQANADPAKDSATEASTADTAAAGPNSLAHLGVASHFSLQHTHNDTNAGELKSPVGSAAWNEELGSKLTWMTQNGLETGSLRVSPEHLGPVEVKISVQNGDASVWFGATHPDTRAALEQALPRLREMFASQGMTLTDSGVSRESPRNRTKSQSPQSVSAVSAVGSADVGAAAAVRMSLGLVDTYA
jgi:flagellar hook-length control protein FliK